MSAAEQYPVVIGSHKNIIDYSKHAGHVILKDGKKLTGVFKYAEMEFPDFTFKFYASDKSSLITRIKFRKIASITLAGADTSLIKSDSTSFFNLKNNNRLYRKLTTGDVEIFDNLFNVSKNSGCVSEEDLVIVHNGKMNSVHSRKELMQLLNSFGKVLTANSSDTVQAIIKEINLESLR